MLLEKAENKLLIKTFRGRVSNLFILIVNELPFTIREESRRRREEVIREIVKAAALFRALKDLSTRGATIRLKKGACISL